MNTDQFLPGREPEVHFDHRERPKIHAGDFSDEDSEIAYSLACFFSWMSGKGFSRGSWLVQHYGPNRKARRKSYAQALRFLRRHRACCGAKKHHGKHKPGCKDGTTHSEVSDVPTDSDSSGEKEGLSAHNQ